MRSILLKLFLVLFAAVYQTTADNCVGSITEAAYDALKALYYSAAGWNWYWDEFQLPNTIWQFETYDLKAPCSIPWQGLNCSRNASATTASNCFIASFVLAERNLKGTLPSELGNLIGIDAMDFNTNLLNGTLPSEIGELIELEYFYINENLLTGSIPTEFGNLINLQSLQFYDNYLHGTIPSELSRLSILQTLALSNNSLSGSVPSELGNLANLLLFEVNFNVLTGSIPSEISNISTLTGLFVNFNLFSGQIPNELGQLSLLTAFFANNNYLEGTIPSELGNLTRLDSITIYSNYIGGAIPTQLGKMKSLKFFEANSNHLEGILPTEFGMLISLEIVSLDFNSLIGTIPTEFGELLNMQILYLFANSFHGTIPSELGNMGNIEIFDVSDNRLEGTLPIAINSWSLLQFVNFSCNRLSGPINVFTSDRLRVIDLSNNYLTGTLPDNLFALSHLQTIVLGQNCFSGKLPTSLCDNKLLEYVVLDLLTGNCGKSDNGVFQGFVLKSYMTGTIPSCIWNSTSIRVLHLLGNGLKGSLSELSAASALSVLAVGSNQLTGSIPISFQRHNFSQLDLSVNRLSGGLGSDLVVGSNATLFDLSVNRLSGYVPNALYSSYPSGIIDVLQGNLFGCEQSDRPTSDISHEAYQCGSSDFQYSLYQWIAGAGCMLLLSSCVALILRTVWAKSSYCSSIFSLQKDFGLILFYSFSCLSISLLCLVLYVIIKQLPQFSSYSSTHTVQYWWTGTIAFLHDWIIALILFSALIVICVTFALSILSLRGKAETEAAEQDRDKFSSFLQTGAAHVINIVVVGIANGLYILIVVDSISNLNLLIIQTILGIFKLAWSSAAVPWLVMQAQIPASRQLGNQLFMILFVFLGAPFASSFCESSSCFYYALTQSNMISYAFRVLVLSADVDCNTNTCFYILVPSMIPIYGSFESPWIYSYQCSSALITGYAPVLIISFLVSGIVLPVTMCLLWICYPHCSRSIKRFIPIQSVTMLSYLYEAEAASLIKEDNNSTYNQSNREQAMTSFGRILLIRYVLGLATMITFGIAVPFLAITVMCDTAINFISVVILGKLLASQPNADRKELEKVRNSFWKGFLLSPSEAIQSIYVVMGFVSVFWTLFVFDWIADVHGLLVGGLSLLVPLLIPISIGFVMLRFYSIKNESEESNMRSKSWFDRSRLKSDNGMELQSPPVIMSPQTTNDSFSTSEISVEE